MRWDDERRWAGEEFGQARLGDARRTARLVRMAAGVARRPGGRVLDVFRSSADRQGAYDFLANERIEADAMLEAMRTAMLRRAQGESECIVVVDGSSLRLKDWKRRKDFGSIGARDKGARGLKVVHALALRRDGTPLGLVDQQWWARSEHTRRADSPTRALDAKETRFWVNSIGRATMAFRDQPTRLWFQIDREGDRFHTHKALRDTGQLFTVRSTYAHRRGRQGTRSITLREAARRGKFGGHYEIDVASRFNRPGRKATLTVRTATLTLSFQDSASDESFEQTLNVVEVRECGRLPRGAERIHWRLLTNHAVDSFEQAVAVVRAYSLRWRIEDLHRTWKSGACKVEQMQLRSVAHATKWAIVLAANAARIERIKHLARNSPDLPASREFTASEIKATRLMKRKYKKRTETIPDTMPTVGQMTLWLAELGGYTGKSSGGPPGSITIRRGLDFILPIAAAFEQMSAERKKR
jgi:hypothetical protein